ncbi:MAG: GFA family protein [Pseudomonadota bacterium]
MAPTSVGACHCEMCRKASGGVYMAFRTKPDMITFDNDDTLTWFQSSDWAQRGFCSKCGSTLAWRMASPGSEIGETMMAAGSLDAWDGVAFDHEVFIDNKPDCYAFAGERHTMTEADIMAMVESAPQ